MTGRGAAGTAIYALTAATLAAAGDTRSTVVLLAAAAVTLPTGMAALVGIYVVYGIVVSLSRALGAQVMSGNGWGPLWFVIVDEAALSVMFAAAAVANAFLVRHVAHQLRANHRVRNSH